MTVSKLTRGQLRMINHFESEMIVLENIYSDEQIVSMTTKSLENPLAPTKGF